MPNLPRPEPYFLEPNLHTRSPTAQGSTGTCVNIEEGPEVPSPFLFKFEGDLESNFLRLTVWPFKKIQAQVSESEVADMLG